MIPRRGFTLLSVLVAIAVLGAFVVVAERLTTSSIRLSRQAQEAQTQMIRWEGLLRALRKDVWRGTLVQVSDRRVRLGLPEGIEAVWTADAEGTVIRTADGQQDNRWPRVADGVRFEHCDGGLVVVVEDPAGRRMSRVPLAAQLPARKDKP